MAEHSIPVDLFNPGQVFACLGFLEVADILCGDAEGGFDWSNEAEDLFYLTVPEEKNGFREVIEFLQVDSTKVEWLTPSAEFTERDGGVTIVETGISASREPKPADLPGRFVGPYGDVKRIIPFGFWADGSSRFHTSFKKSTYSNSSHTRLQNALTAICHFDPVTSAENPFEQKAETKSLFRLDPRGSTDPLNAGTSPDKLRKGGIEVRVATYPLCEVLAVIGLEYARPKRLWDQENDTFRYHVWGRLRSDSDKPVRLPPVLARAAINGTFPFVAARRFHVEHEEAKKGGDRRMTRITEEPNP